MNTKIFDSLNTFGKDSVSATKDLLSINGNLASKLLETQLGFAGLVIEAGAKQMDVASVSEPKELLAKQTALFEETAAKFADASQETTGMIQETGEELKSWFEKSLPSI